MAYINKRQFKTLGEMWTEIRDNNGFVSWETFLEFSNVMSELQAEKDRLNKKSWEYIKEKRKIDKNYARKK